MNVQSGSSLVSDSCNASPVNVPEIIPLSIQGEEDEQNNLVRQEEDKQNNLQQEQKNQEENDVNRQVEKFSYNPDTETFQVWWGGFRKPTTEPESSLTGIDANYIQEAKDNPARAKARPTGARIGSTVGDVSTTDFPMQCSGRFGAVLSLWNALFLLGYTMLEEHLTLSTGRKETCTLINKLTSKHMIARRVSHMARENSGRSRVSSLLRSWTTYWRPRLESLSWNSQDIVLQSAVCLNVALS